MTVIIGIDVSKHSLDVYDSTQQKHLCFANTNEGIQSLVSAYSNYENIKVIMESTGVYQRLAHKTLEIEGDQVFRVLGPKRLLYSFVNFLSWVIVIERKLLHYVG